MVQRERFLIVVVVSLLAGGCVTGTRSLEMPIPQPLPATGDKGAIFINDVHDRRTFEHKPAQASTPSVQGKLEETTPEQRSRLVGRQRNGYGKALGDVALANDSTVHDEVRRLLVAGFASRGYSIANERPDASLVADVEITRFWGWFRPGFAAVGFETDIECKVDISGDGVQQTLDVWGHGLNRGQMASDANWQLSFERAIEDFLVSLDEAMERAGL